MLKIRSPKSLKSLKLLILALPIALLILPLVSASAIAQTTFGRSGQDGDRGREGRAGRDGQNIKVVIDGKPATYDLSGTIGEDAEDGTAGRSANNCGQPYRPEYSLIGASGGRGGDGGNGGGGGNGGNATIFYTDMAMLQQLEIRNGGGKGGRNGRGAIGGKGCGCQEAEWRVKYCNFETERRPYNDAKAAWQYHSRETRLCERSNDGFDFGFDHSKVSEYRKDDWLYRRTNQGVSRAAYYSCQSGRDGETSDNGRNGATGKYGQVTLVPRLDIPAEIESDRTTIASAIGKKVGLVKNIWVEKSGLPRLLRASSDVADTYTYLQDTARLFYRVDWAATDSPTALGVDRTEISSKVNVQKAIATIQYQIPGTLEYQVIAEPNLQVVKITGGFDPSRISSLQVQTISGIGTDNQLILRDRGNVRNLLKETNIEVQCLSKESATNVISDVYQKRRSITFKIPPKTAPTNGAIAADNIYTLPVGRYCSPWLRADNNAAYQIAIKQTTKSGAVYDQSIDKSFVVGKN